MKPLLATQCIAGGGGTRVVVENLAGKPKIRASNNLEIFSKAPMSKILGSPEVYIDSHLWYWIRRVEFTIPVRVSAFLTH